MQKEVEIFQTIQRDYEKIIKNRTTLESQLKENEQVEVEFGLLTDDSVVYKMIGPCLVKQDHVEAKSNVTKRIEFIKGEIKRSELLIKDLEDKQEKQKLKVTKN